MVLEGESSEDDEVMHRRVFKNIYILKFLCVLGLLAVQAFSSVVSGGHPLVVVHVLLTESASLLAGYRL